MVRIRDSLHGELIHIDDDVPVKMAENGIVQPEEGDGMEDIAW